jgi:uncharacterized protein
VTGRFGMRSREEWIPLSDGVRLAATLYEPDGAPAGSRFPAILEYLPYRKDDGLLARDHDLYSFLAARGYIGARVDIRGTGRSEGILPEGEYSEREQLDGLEVIAWLAARPWSTGTVGMWGISWGGFNSIQVAMRHPPALRAIVALCASDDLFRDDVHYIDGLMHVDEYQVMIDLLNATSPAPEFPTDEDTLAARFDRPPWMPEWLRHQRDGPYWRRGSLRPEYSRLTLPALLIGGWYDGYRDSVPRMLEHVPAPTRGIVGPWNHSFPHRATPGPEIEWREEAVRWWDRWLRDEPNGIEREPRVSVYVRDHHPPDPRLKVIPGSWRSEQGWPPRGLGELVLHPAPGGRLSESVPRGRDDLAYVPWVGVEAGAWWGEVAPDQGPLDARCLAYDSDPLPEDLVILGLPRADLRVSAPVPVAHWFVRLCDVAPDGSSTLVTGGGRGGAHRRSWEDPEPIEPGVAFGLEVPLRFTSWTFPSGHRIRLALSNAMWPMIWPTPYPMTTSLHLEAATRVVLPVLPAPSLPPPSFSKPEPVVPAPGVRAGEDLLPVDWSASRHPGTRRAEARWGAASETRFPWGREAFEERLSFMVSERNPADAVCRGEAVTTVRLAGRELVWRGDLELRSDAESFLYRYRRRLWEGGGLLRERHWETRIPRDLQ